MPTGDFEMVNRLEHILLKDFDISKERRPEYETSFLFSFYGTCGNVDRFVRKQARDERG